MPKSFVMKLSIISLIISLLFLTCSHQKQVSKQNRDFYLLAQRAKSEMEGNQYKRWLQEMLSSKKAQLAGLSSDQSREGRILDQHEVMSESSEVGGPQGIHEFQAQNSRTKMKRNDDHRLQLEKQIFYLNSQLSSLESN